MIAKSQHWHLSTLAIAALLAFSASAASALSLGRINVLSALGEPLRAEIDLLDNNAEETASLRVKMADPQAFKLAGLEYHAALANLQVRLERRRNGQIFIQLSGERLVNEPFVDIILEASWNSGRIQRDYTLLLDPPKLRDLSKTALIEPSLTASAFAEKPPSPVTAPVPTPAPLALSASAANSAKPGNTVKPAGAPGKLAPEVSSVRIKPGETAWRLAFNHKPSNISVDQMLLAMLRENPQAFVKSNVNHILAGATVKLPTEAQANLVTAEQAKQIVIAQSQDFNAYRRKLADNVASVAPNDTGQPSKFGLQATIVEKKPVSNAPDKLTLSKGSVVGKSTESQLAAQKNAQTASDRAAELVKNINDLKQLAVASAVSNKVLASAAKPAAAGVKVAAPAKLPVEPVPGLLGALLDNPFLPAAAAALLVLLFGLAGYRLRQRKRAAGLEINKEDPLAPAALFANAGASTSSSAGAPLSAQGASTNQASTIDEVDPIAEADVYLAYGRDIQAEEILKDALRSNPDRLALHQKLLAIYLKRRDLKSFEAIATLAFDLCKGSGVEWDAICQQGLTIDPENALYQPAGLASTVQVPVIAAANLEATQVLLAPGINKAPEIAVPQSVDLDLDLDLDLDFSVEEALPSSAPASPVVASTAAAEPARPDITDAVTPAALDNALPELSFDLSEPAAENTLPDPSSDNKLISGLDFSLPASDTSAAPAAVNQPAEGMLELDLSALTLDAPVAPVKAVEAEHPLEIKLALAQEFKAIGDDEGARALIHEVMAEATGDLQLKAQQALSEL